MISLPLLRRELKANLLIFLLLALVIIMYFSVIAVMYDPEMAEMLQLFAETMPEVMSLLGMTAFGGASLSLLDFVGNYLYGFIMIVFPLLFEILVANRLVARYIDNGSVAYLLATPNRRTKLVRTQALLLFSGSLLLVVVPMAAGIGVCEAMFPGELDINGFLRLNVGALCLHTALGGLCFFCSCAASDLKRSYAFGAGIPILFYLIQMLANMGGKLENLKYATPFTLFSVSDLAAGRVEAVWQCTILALAGILFYVLGILRFSRRDLSV